MNFSQKALSIIKLLIVIFIIGILAASILPHYNKYRMKARDARRMEDLRAIQTALVMYMQRYGVYPLPYKNCDSSIGSCDSCPCNGTDWDQLSNIYKALVEGGFILDLPKDPLNNNEFYYRYIPKKNDNETCGGVVSCYYYQLKCKYEQDSLGVCELKGY